MKQPPRSANFEMTQMRRVDFLNAALHRLQDDVGTIMSLVDAHNNQAALNSQRIVGFWSELRMMLPIIEAVSHVMGIRPQELLGNHLNITTPDLAWDLFRHSLTHGDYLQHGIYQGKIVNWGVSFIGHGHVITSGHIGIDLPTLYQDLETYLQQQIANNDQTLVDIETGVEYGVNGNPRPEIVNDFSRL